MGHLGYHKAVADIWYEANEVNLGCAKYMIKRTLQMFGDYIKDGSLRTDHVYRPVLPEDVPVWGKDALDAFIRQKEKEKYARVQSVSIGMHASVT